MKKEIQINVHKAKDVLNKYKIKNPLLVKIDVQGFEKEVLDGFGSKIKNIDYIIIEESYFNVYKNKKKNLEIKNFLKKKKYKLIKSCNLTFYENKLFQRDALYKNVSNN